MSHEKMRTRSLLVRVVVALVGVVGLWFLGSQLLSAPTLSASGTFLRLTYTSPIGNPELGLVKSVDDDAPQPGDEIEYTLVYSATTPGSQAFNARLYDFLPAGVTLMSANPSYSYNDGVVLFTHPSIAATNRTATIRVRVQEGYEQLHNYALLVADGVTPTHDSLLSTVTQPPQWLRLTKKGDEVVLINHELIYTLRYENTGNVTVNDVTVMDVLPAGVTLDSATPSPDPGWTLPVLTWSLGDLGPGASDIIIITTTAPASTGVITNVALADARQRVVTQTVFATQVISEGAILKVTKSGSSPGVDVGDELVYTLRYQNIGNQPATGVVLTDTLPADVTVTGISPAPTSSTAQRLVWDIGGVISHSSPVAVVVTVTVGGDWSRTLHNAADITAPGSYPDHYELDTTVRKATLYLPIVMRNS